MLTHNELTDLLDYSPITGEFVWKKSINNAVKVGAIAGSLKKIGYRYIGIMGKRYLAHRLAWMYIHGSMPINHIDHINRNKDDNSICNLRDVTPVENGRNRNISKRNKSGINGVSFCNRNKKKPWSSSIVVFGKKKFLGYFASKTDAEKARDEANLKYGFRSNHGK
ncbi:MAG: HNH endonuclease [Epsilonproteobacteria bacterium]|nr:MAG: HNH endonuclease [Campylobacterota bacterium]